DDQSVRVVLNDRATSAPVREALRQALALRGKLSETQRGAQQLERELKVITDDQARLRLNLREMPPTAEAYKRYLKKFDLQETQIEEYQAKVKRLQDEEHAQKKAYDNFLANLNVD